MKIAYILCATVVMFAVVDCRSDLNQDVRALKLKMAGNQLEEKENEDKRIIGRYRYTFNYTCLRTIFLELLLYCIYNIDANMFTDTMTLLVRISFLND